MKTTLNIPQKIRVGFQKREDTYNGQLAYVTYIDEKGVLRKFSSWESWRDKQIEPQEFENVPTSGFVLNKGVGGSRESGGWNPRNEWIRVYDPRGFEFEISVANLLFILQECTSTKGKGIEGEFVYSWDRADLVLLPCDSSNYKAAQEYTQRRVKSVSKKDIAQGGTYITKDGKNVMYLGQHYNFNHSGNYYRRDGLKHVFVVYDKPGEEYVSLNTFDRIAEIIDKNPSPAFIDLYQRLIDNPDFSKLVSLEFEKDMSHFCEWNFKILHNGKIYSARYDYGYWMNKSQEITIKFTHELKISDGVLTYIGVSGNIPFESDWKDNVGKVYGICENGKRVKLAH